MPFNTKRFGAIAKYETNFFFLTLMKANPMNQTTEQVMKSFKCKATQKI